MNVEKYFNKLNKLNELIISDKMEIDYLEQLSKFSNDNEIKLKIEQTENLIYDEMEEYIRLLRNVRNIINKIENVDEKLILKYRYILHYPLRQISDKMKISSGQIWRIQTSALKHANEILKDSDVDA